MIVKKYFSTFLAGTLLATGFVSVAQAGKSDDTLNVAIDRELESIDNYYNTAREGIVISRMVWDACCIGILKLTSIYPILPRPTNG